MGSEVNQLRSIVKCIYEHSLETPEKPAIIATDCTVDYKTLWSAVTNVCSLLKEQGIKTGDRVMLEAGPTVEYLVCCYGIHLSGAVHVPVEKDVPESRIEEIAKEITPSLILSGQHPLEKLGCDLNTILSKEPSDDFEFPSEDMLQEILFTTGTTGKSKGVMITHYGQMNMCESQNAVLNYSVDNVWMIPTPMNHAAGLRKTHMSMVRGSSVLLMDGFKNLKLFFSNMREYGVTSLYLPPSAVHYILLLAGKELAKFDEQLDFLYSSSSALPGGDKEKLISLLPHVRKFDAYGGSEVGAVVYIDYNAVQGDPRRVGKPNPGVDVFIVDENYKPFKATEENPGIIAIRSNTVTAGYWNEPELTAETVQDGVIYMTDLGYLDEEGYLYLVGRRDDVINVGGLKVAPTEVEDVVQRFEKIAECACVPYKDPAFGLCLKMYVAMKDGFDFDTNEITEYMESKLEAYKIPKFIEQISEIPKTFNGKIDRKKLIGK
ncbi:MAG: acyl--CoA ligase [Clostridiales bacterium]|nr:acyl--CoA ligase [Clostridiales bacterium]